VALEDVNVDEGVRQRIIEDTTYLNFEMDFTYYSLQRNQSLTGRAIYIGEAPYTLEGTRSIIIQRFYWTDQGKTYEFTKTLNDIPVYMGSESLWMSFMS